MIPTVEQILDFLNTERVRATYGAVAEVLGITPRSVGVQLGSRRPKASWVVNAGTGEPTGYDAEERHSLLYEHAEIIGTGAELLRRMRMRDPR